MSKQEIKAGELLKELTSWEKKLAWAAYQEFLNVSEVERAIRERYPRAVEVQQIGDIAVFKVVDMFSNDFTWSYAVSGRVFSHFYASRDEAILGALGFKYDGLNSQFSLFAAKMLGIKSE